MRKIILFTSMLLVIWGCSNYNDFQGLDYLNKEEKPLQIITRILTSRSTNFVQELPQGATIGLHITSGHIGNLYNSDPNYRNVKAIASSNEGKIIWQQSPSILLNSKDATIYAYYPYQEGVKFDPGQIPVRIAPKASETNDYMYGTHAMGQKAVNNTSPVVLLSMNHALSLISFQLKRATNEKRAFIVSSAQIGNKPGGTTLAGEGTLDISTGNITASTTNNNNASTLLSLSNPTTLLDTFCVPLELKVMPTSKIIRTGEVEVLFIINGKTYSYEIPANTQWVKGKKYIYKLSFNGESLQLQKQSITDWLPGYD